MMATIGALLTIFSVFLAGCAESPQRAGGVPNKTPVTSVVSLSPSTTELVQILNFSGILKGRTQADDFPPTVANLPVVASVKPDYEKITEIKPNLVLLDASLYNEGDMAKIKELGFETYVVDAKTVKEFETEVYELGAKIAGEMNASEYVDKIRAQTEAAQANMLDPRPKVAVIMPGEGTEHWINGVDSFLSDVIRSAGGEPVGPKADRFVSLSPEFFLTVDPDVIVVPFAVVRDKREETQRNAERVFRTVSNDPRLRNLRALKRGAVVPVDQNVLLRRGSRVDRLIEELAVQIRKYGSNK